MFLLANLLPEKALKNILNLIKIISLNIWPHFGLEECQILKIHRWTQIGLMHVEIHFDMDLTNWVATF